MSLTDQYYLLFRTLPIGIVFQDRSGEIVSANPAAQEILGLTLEQMRGRTSMDPRWQPVREDGSPFPGERHPSMIALRSGKMVANVIMGVFNPVRGDVRWLKVTAIPVFATGSHVVERVYTFFEDVSESKKLEQQFLHAQKMEIVGRLAGGVAHDFNNLLTVINGCCDLLLELRPEEQTSELVTEVRQAGERASALTRQLLAFSRQQVLQPTVLPVNTAVTEAAKMLRRLIGEDITLTTSLDPNAAPIKVDPGQLEQALINLAVNARDAMPTGGRLHISTRDVTISAGDSRLTPGRYTELVVADSGTGIDEALRERIFEPFFTTKEIGKGTGLGLATVHGIVAQSGGQIHVESEVGKGTSFFIYFPAADVPAPAEGRRGGGKLPRGTETILLVEDEPNVRAISRDVLRACGYTVLEAADGVDALSVAAAAPRLDLVLSDVVMPRLSGRLVVRHVQERWPACRVLLVSGYTDDAVTRHGIRTAEFAFLAKPFTPLGLASKVREVLDAAA